MPATRRRQIRSQKILQQQIEHLEPRLLLAAVPIVSVIATKPLASETAPLLAGAGVLTFVRTGEASLPLTIHYTLSGTATDGVDYAGPDGTALIQPGQHSVKVVVFPANDGVAEPNETVIATITPDLLYNIGPRPAATVTIKDNSPTVNVVASKPKASEINAGAPSSLGKFTFTRTGPLTNPLTVDFTTTGTATDGTDFAVLPASVTFLAGKATATITVTPITDNDAEGAESIILTLDPAATNFKSGIRPAAAVTIADAQPVVSISQVKNLSESGSPGTFRITRTSGDFSAPLSVSFTLTGTATEGTDFETLSTLVIIPAGQRSVLIPITPISDLDSEGPETIIVNLIPDASFTLDPVVARQSATLSLADIPPLNFMSDTAFNVDGASYTYLAVSPNNSVNQAQIDVADAGLLGQRITLVSNGPGGFSDLRTYNFLDDGTNVFLTSRSLFIPDISTTTVTNPGITTFGTSGVVTGGTLNTTTNTNLLAANAAVIGNSIGNVPAVITSPQLILVPSTLDGGTFTDTAPATMVFGTNSTGLASGTVAAKTTLVGSTTVVSPLGTFAANRVDITLTTAMSTAIGGTGTIGSTAGTFGMTERFTLYIVPGIGIVRAIVRIDQTSSTPGNLPVTANMTYTASLFSYAV